MARKIIVVEDVSDDVTSIEKALSLLQDNGFKAYQVSTIFNNSNEWLSLNQSLEVLAAADDTTETMVASGEVAMFETLLNQKTLLEDELRKYRILLENSSDLIYALDLGGNITFVTSNVEEILGYRPDEVIGHNFLSVMPPDQHSFAVKAFAAALPQFGPSTVLTNFVTRAGQLLPVEVSARTYYEEGVPVLQVGVVRDVRERNRLETEMLKRNRELSALYSVASALTCSLDMKTLLDECLARMMAAMNADSGSIFLMGENGDFRQGTQRGLDENFKKIYPILRASWATIEQRMHNGESLIVEDLAVLPEASRELLEETGYKSAAMGPLRANNSTLGTFMLMSKGTHTFTAQDQDLFTSLGNQVGLALQTGMLYAELNNTVLELRQTNQQLDEATRHKSEFLASMSHELRTPLNAIIGFSEVLQDQTFGPLNQKQQRYVSNILNSGKHLLALINDVLDLTKVEAGKMKLELEELNPLEVINEAQATVVTLAHKKQIVLSTRRSNKVPPIHADHGKIKQILYNLYSNAIKFTDEGGRVETATHLTRRADGDYLEISIIDNGIGIRSEDQERIFEEFQMVDSTLSKRQQGTGLGLALCRKLTQLHGGTVTVKSVLGEGSTFTVSLPLKSTAVVAINSAYSLPPGLGEAEAWQQQMQKVLKEGAGDLVLVVEDDDKAAELLELYVSQNGYKVERSRSGEEALQKARSLHPAVITLDIILPHKNGWDVLRELKADPQTADIPVLVVSMLDNREISFQLGAVACFVKPVQREELLGKVTQLKLETIRRKRREHIEQHLLHGEPLRAVVIDNSWQDTNYITEILSQAGLVVTTARTGQEGWQQVQTDTPDLVVLDLLLPDADNFNLLAALRQNLTTFEVPVVVFTAKDLNADERGFLAQQAEAVLQKGVQGRQQLLDEILKLATVKK